MQPDSVSCSLLCQHPCVWSVHPGQSMSQGCVLVILRHPSLLEQISTGTFSIFSPQGALGKGMFGGNGDARLELMWKAEEISPNHAGVKCVICVWQPHVDTGIWPAQTSLTSPEGDLHSHLREKQSQLKTKCLGRMVPHS